MRKVAEVLSSILNCTKMPDDVCKRIPAAYAASNKCMGPTEFGSAVVRC